MDMGDPHESGGADIVDASVRPHDRPREQMSFEPKLACEPRTDHAASGTRTHPSINTRALRLMTALVTTHSPSRQLACAPTRSVPDG